MPVKTQRTKPRASPLFGVRVPFGHTQDFFAALNQGLQPKDIEHPILRTIARAHIYQNLTSDRNGLEPNYVAHKGKGVWFEFAYVDIDGRKVAKSLEEFPDTAQVPEWAHIVPCRKCPEKVKQSETFCIEVIVFKPNRKPIVGFLTIECGELIADAISEQDFF